MREAPDRHRDHVCSPLAAGVDGARLFDAQGIDGLHDRRSDRAGRCRHRALLLFTISDDRFRGDMRDALDLAGAIAWLPDWSSVSARADSRCGLALAPLPLWRASRVTRLLVQIALPVHPFT